MFPNVLVPVDDSPFAEHALPWALAAAGPGGTVHLVHVHTTPPPLLVDGVVVSDPGIDQTVREQETDYLRELTDRVQAAAPDLTIEARIVEAEDRLVDALVAAAADAAADLVVMTTHGRGPFARFWLGSVSDELLRHSPVPVLMVRGADERPNALGPPPLRNLIIPLDGSDLAERIVDPAVRLANTFGAELTLLLMLSSIENADAAARIEQPDLADSANPLNPTQRAGMYLDRVARSLEEKHVAVQTKVFRAGAPAATALELAKNDPATGVALATHGRSGLTRLLMGSVADEVIRGAAGPVLVYHPPG